MVPIYLTCQSFCLDTFLLLPPRLLHIAHSTFVFDI